MKKLLALSCAMLFLALNSTEAQYKVMKHHYDYRNYDYRPGDPYNPAIAGLVSFFVPGLGQIFAGETNRGLAFLGGYMGCAVVTGVGFSMAISDIENEATVTRGSGLILTGVLGSLGVGIWSIVDAVRVAKVNNMVFRDRHGLSSTIQFQPFVRTYAIQGQNHFSSGLSMNIVF